MQRVTLVRYTAKPEHADENEKLARTVFAELRARAPKQLMYSLFRNGNDFVHLLVNSESEDSTGVTDLPSFKAYVEGVEARCVAPPQQTRLGVHLLESYGLESAAR